MHRFIWHLICIIECYISDMWKVLNAMNLVYEVLHGTGCSHFVFCVYIYIVQVNAVITKLLSLLFIKFHDNILPLLLYNELFHG